ncbi:MAG: hypothetical protein LBJ64_04015 [Deltaproteobacteria bacterium]|nr:hypothetical protein [Deltaproteobacteria bacterium]
MKKALFLLLALALITPTAALKAQDDETWINYKIVDDAKSPNVDMTFKYPGKYQVGVNSDPGVVRDFNYVDEERSLLSNLVISNFQLEEGMLAPFYIAEQKKWDDQGLLGLFQTLSEDMKGIQKTNFSYHKNNPSYDLYVRLDFPDNSGLVLYSDIKFVIYKNSILKFECGLVGRSQEVDAAFARSDEEVCLPFFAGLNFE